MSLNSAFYFSRDPKVLANDQELINAYFKNGGTVGQCPPGNAASNEAVRATNELVAQKRKEFRNNRKARKA